MTISGIPAGGVPSAPSRPDARDGISRQAGGLPATPATDAASAPTRLTSRVGSRPASAIPVSPPPGTDPELWSVLTSEEREFFARNATQGPLTYARVTATQAGVVPNAPTVRGGRVDVRV